MESLEGLGFTKPENPGNLMAFAALKPPPLS